MTDINPAFLKLFTLDMQNKIVNFVKDNKQSFLHIQCSATEINNQLAQERPCVVIAKMNAMYGISLSA